MKLHETFFPKRTHRGEYGVKMASSETSCLFCSSQLEFDRRLPKLSKSLSALLSKFPNASARYGSNSSFVNSCKLKVGVPVVIVEQPPSTRWQLNIDRNSLIDY